FYDRGPGYGVEGGPEADEDRYIEIWNLVFMENERAEGTGKESFEILGPLPNKNIDTGMGVERVAFLLQGVENVYETDLLRPVISTAERLSGATYGSDPASDVRFRVIADHARTAYMLISDGVMPGNEGRGYVLRRLLRRIVRSVRLLGWTAPPWPSSCARSGTRWARPTRTPSRSSTASSGPRSPRRSRFSRLSNRGPNCSSERPARPGGPVRRCSPARRPSPSTTRTVSRSISPSRWPPRPDSKWTRRGSVRSCPSSGPGPRPIRRPRSTRTPT